MDLIQIKEKPEENVAFISNPLCQEGIYMTTDFYKKVGFAPPWIGYFVTQNNEIVGSAGFKGQPIQGTVEIAYGTFEKYQKQGIGTEICGLLVELSLNYDSSVNIKARTLPENNFSTKILRKNGFEFIGIADDPEDGTVWEWEFRINKLKK